MKMIFENIQVIQLNHENYKNMLRVSRCRGLRSYNSTTGKPLKVTDRDWFTHFYEGAEEID